MKSMQVPPGFKITEKILILSSSIDAQCARLKNQRISKYLFDKLVHESLLKSSLFSAKIEGNRLEYGEVTHLSTKQKEHIEVRNLIRALKYIKNRVKPGQQITLKFIARLHAIAMSKLVSDIGAFRSQQNAIFNPEGFVIYMPPPPEEAKSQLKKTLKYLNSEKHNKIPLIKACLAHLIFEKIHPFIDGNGRVGRLMIYAMLRVLKTDFPEIVSFEEKLSENKEDYYYHLENSFTVKFGTTEYLEFMLAIFDESLADLIDRVSKDSNVNQNLLPRREEILDIIHDHKIVTVDFLKRRFQNLTERTLRNDLADLIKRNLIKKIGETRGAVYRII